MKTPLGLRIGRLVQIVFPRLRQREAGMNPLLQGIWQINVLLTGAVVVNLWWLGLARKHRLLALSSRLILCNRFSCF